ncbi:MAG TPA: radical SAM protein [Candidatus Brocadiia bacterium]|nr:radical SAM protein [Candidatus Brocadiia bacterium]
MADLWRMFRTGLTVLRKPLRVYTPPLHFQLEPATGCNLLCKTCQVPGYTERKVMPLDKFVHAFDQIKPKKIGLSGAGEPFLNRDMIDIISYATRQGASVLTTTNFTLCRPKLEELAASGLKLLKVSLDAATPETYHRIRGKDLFNHILEDLKSLQEIKKKRGAAFPYVRLQFVLQHDNLDEAPALTQVARDVGADSVYFQPLETLLISERKEALTEGVTRERMEQRLKEALASAEAAGLGTNAGVLLRSLPLYYRKYEAGVPATPPSRVCLLPWFSVYITVEGNVRPCCSFGEGETLVMGNVFEEPFDRIWNNDKYVAFRQAALDRKLAYAVCRNCTPNRLRDFMSLSAVLPGFFGRRRPKVEAGG